jgi:hypothetical protein
MRQGSLVKGEELQLISAEKNGQATGKGIASHKMQLEV